MDGWMDLIDANREVKKQFKLKDGFAVMQEAGHISLQTLRRQRRARKKEDLFQHILIMYIIITLVEKELSSFRQTKEADSTTSGATDRSGSSVPAALLNLSIPEFVHAEGQGVELLVAGITVPCPELGPEAPPAVLVCVLPGYAQVQCQSHHQRHSRARAHHHKHKVVEL
jgi:hypothetical protein